MTCHISPRTCLAMSSQGRQGSLIEHLQPAQPCQSACHTHFISLNLRKPHSIGYYYSHCTDGKKRLGKLNQLAQSKHLINDTAAYSYPLNHGLSTADNFHTLLFFFIPLSLQLPQKQKCLLPIQVHNTCVIVFGNSLKSQDTMKFFLLSLPKHNYPSILV